MTTPGPAVPGKHKWTTQERVDKFLSDVYWTDCNLFAAEKAAADRGPEHTLRAKSFTVDAPRVEKGDMFPQRVSFAQAKEYLRNGTRPTGRLAEQLSAVTDTAVGDSFGPLNTTHWFLIEITPANGGFAAPGDDVEEELRWCTGAEGLVYGDDGTVLCGLTGGGRDQVPLAAILNDDQRNSPLRLFVEMACNSLCGDGNGTMISAPDTHRRFTLSVARVTRVSRQLSVFRLDLTMLLELSQAEGINELVAAEALACANRAVNAFFVEDSAAHARACAITSDFFRRHAKDGASASALHQVHAVGHCHIDCAWLWRYCESRRKAARSWASQLFLAQHPRASVTTARTADFVFAASQPVQWEWVKQDQPQLFQRLRDEVVRGGQPGFVCPTGAAWTECDGNIPSGESFMRQFFYGQRFLEQHFGARSEIFWLPDTFGYSGQLPQIARLYGVQYFLSQKLSWNLINKPPHTTFHWQGIDGKRSTLLAHFPPTDTYGSTLGTSDLVKHARTETNRDAGQCAETLMLFGHGDGGGGPTEEMLQRLDRFKAVAPRALGLQVDTATTPQTFFENVAAADRSCPQLQRHVGELYFELHRGTLTTNIRLKGANVRAQAALREAEALCTHASLVRAGSFKYPADRLEALWKTLLLQQFHDVLPGSSIQEANEDALHAMAQLTDEAFDWAAAAITAVWGSPFDRCNPGRAVVNMTPVSIATTSGGDLSATEAAATTSIPPYTIGTPDSPPLPTQRQKARFQSLRDGSVEIATDMFTCRVERGCVVSSFAFVEPDGPGPELVGPHGWLRPALYDDVPFFWDAWDVEGYHAEKPIALPGPDPVTCTEDAEGWRLKSSWAIGSASKISVSLRIGRTAAPLRYTVEADWHEQHRLLKLLVSTTITASAATFDAQFGHVERPTHANTSHDAAKFETSLQRWVKLSQPGATVGVVQANGMHAATVRGGDIALSMVRSPTRPDPSTDRGRHRWTVDVMPFAATSEHAALHLHKQAFACELGLLPAGHSANHTSEVSSPRPAFTVVSVAPSNVFVSSIRREGATVVIHAYETLGAQTARATLSVPGLREEAFRATRRGAPDGTQVDLSVSGNRHIALGAFAAFEVAIITIFS